LNFEIATLNCAQPFVFTLERLKPLQQIQDDLNASDVDAERVAEAADHAQSRDR
jgi:hypothetical protein